MRRTAAMIAAGTLVILAGCSGDDAGGGTSDRPADAAPATVELAVADGAVDVSPVVPLDIAVEGGSSPR